MMFGSKQKKYLLSGRHSWFTSRFVVLLICVAIISLFSVSFVLWRSRNGALPSMTGLYTDWKNASYTEVHTKTGLILAKRPLDGEALSLRGFSAYYLYCAQTDPAIAQEYLVDAIVSLRNAWYRVSSIDKPVVAYILGKGYYQRGFYYADLAMKYLAYARDSGLQRDDLSEYIGLTADLLGDNALAIASFTEALASSPSDLLLFTLSRSYLKAEDIDKAKQYFLETIRVTSDDLLANRCRFELGMILIKEERFDEAESEFTTIMEKEPNSADAQYGLGVLYEARGELVKARAAWRKALRLNPVHSGARQKMNI